MNVLTGHCVSNCHSVMVTYFSWIEVVLAGGGLREKEGEKETKNNKISSPSYGWSSFKPNTCHVQGKFYKFLMILGTTGALKFAVL